MPNLLLSTMSIPAGSALAAAARESGWKVFVLDETPKIKVSESVVYYGGSDTALEAASRFHLALLEPSLDLLARLPVQFRQRAVEFGTFDDLHKLKAQTFVKPADPLDKSFDAGIYSNVRDIRAPRGIDPRTPVLVAEPVQWLAEFRCFVLEGKVVTSSPYLSFGRPVWRPYGQGGEKSQTSANVLACCDRLVSQGGKLPPAYVVDVGLIEDRGWAVVEFNPAWCSGLLGADPGKVLPVLLRVSLDANKVSPEDRAWMVRRS